MILLTKYAKFWPPSNVPTSFSLLKRTNIENNLIYAILTMGTRSMESPENWSKEENDDWHNILIDIIF